jgi:beta-lactamase class A
MKQRFRLATPLIVAAVAVVLGGTGHPGPAVAGAQESLTPEAALERLFTVEPVAEEWFAPSVLDQVPLGQLATVVQQIKSQAGAFQSVQRTDDGYLIAFENGDLLADFVSLDAQGRFTGLHFGLLRPRDPALALSRAREGLQTLPGEVSVLVTVDGEDALTMRPEMPLAIGSSFKLAVLAALKDEIAAGKRSWSDVVQLQPEWKSLPSGAFQDWPDGISLTLETLAAQMISVSDNTATDALIHILGRESIERFSGGNRPLLTTRNAFILKDPKNADLLDRYRAGDEAERRRVLADTDARPLPNVTVFAGGPLVLDVEWYFSARELCGLMARVADLPLTGINPGLATRQDWARIAFKGGSEPGVLNLTHALTSKDGRTVCVSATWNNTENLDTQQFTELVGQLLAAFR